MGSFNITIQGIGQHHNDNGDPRDANRMAARFVAELQAAGHHIKDASITYGGADNLACPDNYLHMRDLVEKDLRVQRDVGKANVAKATRAAHDPTDTSRD